MAAGRTAAAGERMQAVLAGAYLGIGGIFFMFPGYGLALAGIAAAAATADCFRSARAPG